MDRPTGITGPTWPLEDVLAGIPAGQPYHVLSLIKYHDRAAYPEGHPNTGITGKEAYWDHYIRMMSQVAAPLGVSLAWRAPAYRTIAGPPGEEWDELVVFHWPSTETMLSLERTPAFQASSIHRQAAIRDLRMTPFAIPAQGRQLP